MTHLASRNDSDQIDLQPAAENNSNRSNLVPVQATAEQEAAHDEARLAAVERQRREVETQIAIVAERIEAKRQAVAHKKRKVQLAQSMVQLEQSKARLRDMERQLEEIDDGDGEDVDADADANPHAKKNRGTKEEPEQSRVVRKGEKDTAEEPVHVPPLNTPTQVLPHGSVMAMWVDMVGQIGRGQQLNALIGYHGRNELAQFEWHALSPFTERQCKTFMDGDLQYLFPWRSRKEYNELLRHHAPTVTWFALWQMPSRDVWPSRSLVIPSVVDKRRLSFLRHFVLALWPLLSSVVGDNDIQHYLVHLRGNECQQFSNGYVVFRADAAPRFFNADTVAQRMTPDVASQYKWGLRGNEAMTTLSLQQ